LLVIPSPKPRPARLVSWTNGNGNAQRKYIDLINEATSKWANWDPPKRIRVGDFGTIDKKTGALEVEGNIYTHWDIAPLSYQYPPFEAAETDVYQIHSQQVRRLDVPADVGASTTADDRPIVLKSRWQFNSKGGAVLLMYRLRLFRVPKGFFDEFDLPILKRKVVVTQVYECPGFYMHLSNQASGPVTVSLRSATSASSLPDPTLARIGWSVEGLGATGVIQYAYRPGAVYSPLFGLKSYARRSVWR
jgi:hypothetical protein